VLNHLFQSASAEGCVNKSDRGSSARSKVGDYFSAEQLCRGVLHDNNYCVIVGAL